MASVAPRSTFYTQPRGASADNGVREPTMTLTGVAVRLSSAFSIQTTKLGHGWWSGTWTKRGSGRKQLLAYMRVLSWRHVAASPGTVLSLDVLGRW